MVKYTQYYLIFEKLRWNHIRARAEAGVFWYRIKQFNDKAFKIECELCGWLIERTADGSPVVVFCVYWLH